MMSLTTKELDATKVWVNASRGCFDGNKKHYRTFNVIIQLHTFLDAYNWRERGKMSG